MLFYGLTTLMEILSLLRLRQQEPLTPRPFRVPLGRTALSIACVPPMLLCVLLIVLAPLEAWLLLGITSLVGLFSYSHRTGWRKMTSSAYGDIALVAFATASMSGAADTGGLSCNNDCDQGDELLHATDSVAPDNGWLSGRPPRIREGSTSSAHAASQGEVVGTE